MIYRSKLHLFNYSIKRYNTLNTQQSQHLKPGHNIEVFAVPGEAGKKLSVGPNWLIKKGAKLVEKAEDVIIDLGIALGESTDITFDRQSVVDSLTKNEKTVFSVFKAEALHVDEIIKLTEMEPSNVLSTLLSLELNGFIVQLQGKYFQLSM